MSLLGWAIIIAFIITFIVIYSSIRGTKFEEDNSRGSVDGSYRNHGCEIDVSKICDKEPLFIDPKTRTFIEPRNDKINLEGNQYISVSCAEGKFDQPFEEKQSMVAHCNNGHMMVDGKPINIEKISCSESVRSKVRGTDSPCLGGVGKIFEIGFQTGDNFDKLITVCHDKISGRSHYAVHKLKSTNSSRQKRPRKSKFFNDSSFFQGLDLNNLYKLDTQRQTCESFGHSKFACAKLIKQKGSLFLSRGHLTPRSDFVFAPHQRATMNYINTGPQWQAFNGPNWAAFEENLRTYSNKGTNIKICTGIHDILEFNGQPMFLSPKKIIPIPKNCYKILVWSNNLPVVVVGVNNPRATVEEIQSDYMYCDEKIKSPFYTEHWENPKKGYMYSCTLKDFQQHVPNLPSF